MKGLRDLKKLFVVCSLFGSYLMADNLGDILSHNKSQLFEYDKKSNEIQNKILTKSWVNPIRLQYRKNYSTQYTTKTTITDNFSISIDQPIFRSGGIYYAIKYANATYRVGKDSIEIQKRAMIADAVSVLFNLKKIKLQQRKLQYQIKNDKIDIIQKRDSYSAGILDSSFLDQALLKKSQDETALLELKFSLMELKQKFSLLSDKNPDKLRLPKLKIVSKLYYQKHNLQLKRDRDTIEQKRYDAKMTQSKYLPAISLQGQYIDGTLNPTTVIGIKDEYYNYGFSISMPIDINSFNDIELAKVAKLKAQTQLIDTKHTIKEEYDWILNSIEILDKKIALTYQDIKLYKNLYKLTSNLVKAGQKTQLDADVMFNTLHIKKLDTQIYKVEKQLQILQLYMRVNNVI
jgi:outer membrane protein TolC